MEKVKYYIEKYGILNLFFLVIKHVASRLILFSKKINNALIELTTNDYILIKSSRSKPLFVNNWGDYISVILVKNLSKSKKVINYSESWNIKKRENYLCVGSIITWMTTDSSIIWGSGVVYPDDKIPAKPIKVLAVRGPLTRQYLLDNGVECPEIYGDPALLLPRIYKPHTIEKKYKFGIIPHFRDKKNELISHLTQEDLSKELLVIDVQNVKDWRFFIDQILKCEYIISSSLHGIIVADAYKVPNIWAEFKNGERKRFAFEDYLLSVSRNNSSPVVIDGSFSFTNLESLILRDWTPPEIDLDKLLSVSPF